MCVLSLNPNSLFSVSPHLDYFVVANTVVYPTAIQGCNSLKPKGMNHNRSLLLPCLWSDCRWHVTQIWAMKNNAKFTGNFRKDFPPWWVTWRKRFVVLSLSSFLTSWWECYHKGIWYLEQWQPSDKCMGILQKMVEYDSAWFLDWFHSWNTEINPGFLK